MPIVKLDLANWEETAVLLQPIELGLVEVLTAAPPCGTASRAREIPIPGGPKPLRSEEFPRGLPNLSQVDKERVQKANDVYDTIFILVMAMLAIGKGIIIENPLRSLLWEFPTYKKLLSEGCFDVCLQNCKFSVGTPSRAKWSRFRTNIESLKALAGPCRLEHAHLEWGRNVDGSFVTADEAAYPRPLCQHLANAIVSHLHSKAAGPFSQIHLASLQSFDTHKKRRLVGFQQPRGNKLPSLISEFSEIVVLEPNSELTKWQKLLRHNLKGGDNLSEQFLCPVVGVFRQPVDFVECAKRVTHPLDMFENVNSFIFHAVIDNIEHSPADTAKFRVDAIKSNQAYP
jgi:hypothetical protein